MGCWRFDVESLKRANLRQQPNDYGQKLRSESRMLVVWAPVFFVFGPGEQIPESFWREIRQFFQFRLFDDERHPGQARNPDADSAAVVLNCLIFILEYLPQLQTVYIQKGPVQQTLGNLKTYEVMKCLRIVALLGYLENVKAELSPDVGLGVLGIGHVVSKFGTQLGKFQRHRRIDRRVACDVGSIVGKSTQGKRQFVQVLGIANQFLDKVSTANIVDKVAEELVAVRIITHVLNQAAAVGISVGLAQIVFGRVRIAAQQYLFDVRVPKKIDDLLMRE